VTTHLQPPATSTTHTRNVMNFHDNKHEPAAADMEVKDHMVASVVDVPESREPVSLRNLSQEELDKMTKKLVRKMDLIIL
jgi:hypothetical protein